MDNEHEPYETPRSDVSRPADGGARNARSLGGRILFYLLLPFLLSLAILAVGTDRLGGAAAIPLLIGCPVVGIVTACMFAASLTKISGGERLAVAVGMMIVFTIASLALAFGGCMIAMQTGIVK